MAEEYEGIVHPSAHIQSLGPYAGAAGTAVLPENEYDTSPHALHHEPPSSPATSLPSLPSTHHKFVAETFEYAARGGDPSAQWAYAHCLQLSGDVMVSLPFLYTNNN